MDRSASIAATPDLNRDASDCPEAFHPHRPVQWLGSKLRSVPSILAITDRLVDRGRVYDLFSGSSVVSQALAQRSPVTAVDAMISCATMAGATLGVGRHRNEHFEAAALSLLLNRAGDRLSADRIRFETHLTSERQALSNADLDELNRAEASYPLAWRQASESSANALPLLTSLYAGSYFGLSQSIALDALRAQIDDLDARSSLSQWMRAVYLTALMSVCSEIVHSAGKHFAQPLTSTSGKDLAFRKARRLKDRSFDVFSLFARAVRAVADHAPEGGNRNAVCCAAESSIHDQIIAERPTLIYADPPYTAQQYSRFYHVLETVVSYRRPDLGRSVTAGIYPVDRYLSPYCSKRQAPAAFESLVKMCRTADASLVLSYSASSSRSNGNARMITLDALMEICSSTYGRKAVSAEPLGHRYRQFNSAAHSNSLRSDSEVLIVCER